MDAVGFLEGINRNLVPIPIILANKNKSGVASGTIGCHVIMGLDFPSLIENFTVYSSNNPFSSVFLPLPYYVTLKSTYFWNRHI